MLFHFFIIIYIGKHWNNRWFMGRKIRSHGYSDKFCNNSISFLSGTFYSIERLPDFLQTISKLNPFFYMIDGFRYVLLVLQTVQ